MSTKNILLIVVLCAIGGTIYYIESQKPAQVANVGTASGIPLEVIDTATTTSQATAPSAVSADVAAAARARIEGKKAKFERAKEITNPSGFLNTDSTDPITIKSLIGKKVVLVDFWTYSCINCQRTFPYLNAWYAKYKDQGLEIVSIHTPEFKFEWEIANVRMAAEKYGIKYPIVLDNDHGTWNAYGNQYWPRHYLIDIDGFIVEDHIGEGGYAETEQKIQELLKERMVALGLKGSVDSSIAKPAGVEAVNTVGSPETYFGASRNQYFGNGTPSATGEHAYTVPAALLLNKFYLDGTWNIGDEFITSKTASAKIVFKYNAQKVFLVGAAANPAIGVHLKILRDGKPVGDVHGADAATDGSVTVKENRLYRLIEDPVGAGEHTLEILIENPGLEAYTFTFG